MATKRGKTPNKMNRAQLKAMEVRAAETLIQLDDEAQPVSADGVAALRARSLNRPVAISRAMEYEFIRKDLNRLLLISIPLLVIMFVILALV